MDPAPTPARSAAAVPLGASLRVYRRIFRELPELPPGELTGRYAALPLGPRWYRALFRLLLAVGGLRGWAGKEFAPDGRGANLCRRGDRVVRRSRLRRGELARSAVDGRPSLLLRYGGLSPLRLVQDELRRVGGDTLLGVTYLRLGPLRRIALPFAIARVGGRAAGG